VAPAATGASGTGYTIATQWQWKTAQTATAGTDSTFDGAVNTAAMVTAGINDHPAAKFCTELAIGGFTDWYLPARHELDIAYENLKPTTESNSTSNGINPFAVPARPANRTTTVPGQTSIALFQSGGAQSFPMGTHWTSTEGIASTARTIAFGNGALGNTTKTASSGGGQCYGKMRCRKPAANR
jgi:hypothetical protein